MGIQDITTQIITAGAGVVALAILFWIFLKMFNGIIENNTKAMHEMSRSNDNVAQSLAILKSSIENSYDLQTRTATMLDKHDTRAERIENELIKVSERTKK
ncbi:hypothetical protein [Fusibacter ferrireducens]|uniref:Uncharacterized protein n=1 Tax=Fusibacter ferrireducens TaxID=2785058 RepID=A0ABR9ZT20_9FIRM|nr:hypothetical protein [Fusibacter ferrireducens]MBF4693626.1 hypothetical protein [Fusibacter ferrireducens]